MLRKLSFENYKAFDNGSIEIRPITILLGANSVGKSSILQLLLLLQQTSEADENYKSALKLNGGFISLGEGQNLLRNKNVDKPLILSFDFKNNELLKKLSVDLIDAFCNQLLLQSTYISKITERPFSFLNNLFKKIGINYKSDNDIRYQMFLYDIEKNKKSFEKSDIEEMINFLHKESGKIEINILSEQKYLFHFNKNYFGGFSNISKNKDEFLLAYDFLYGLSKMNLNQDFSIKYFLKSTIENIIRIEEIQLTANNKEILSIKFSKILNENKISLNSPIFDQNPLKSSIPLDRINKTFDPNKTIFNFINIPLNETQNKEKDFSVFGSIISNILKSYVESVNEYFTEDKINYVSPLRAHPKRYYFLDKAKINKYLDTLDGDSLTEILRGNYSLKSQVNNWFKKFGLRIDVDQLKDIIHKLVVKQNSLDLDITDVGFGISQVLPVIVQGFLSSRDSLTIIEQPEIHLHPKMQADLSDLFIDIVQSRERKQTPTRINKYILVETHSEYLLKRLRRRISEGIISAKNVAIYLIDPQTVNSGANLRLLEIEEKGNFEWPVDFYADELLKDTFEFLKNQ